MSARQSLLAPVLPMEPAICSTIDSHWPDEEPPVGDLFPDEEMPDEFEDAPYEFDAEYWHALLPDDDYDPQPEPGDFWIDDDSLEASLRRASHASE